MIIEVIINFIINDVSQAEEEKKKCFICSRFKNSRIKFQKKERKRKGVKTHASQVKLITGRSFTTFNLCSQTCHKKLMTGIKRERERFECV